MKFLLERNSWWYVGVLVAVLSCLSFALVVYAGVLDDEYTPPSSNTNTGSSNTSDYTDTGSSGGTTVAPNSSGSPDDRDEDNDNDSSSGGNSTPTPPPCSALCEKLKSAWDGTVDGAKAVLNIVSRATGLGPVYDIVSYATLPTTVTQKDDDASVEPKPVVSNPYAYLFEKDTTPLPPQLQSQVDALKVQKETGTFTAALTPAQVAQLEYAKSKGLDINNKAVEVAVLALKDRASLDEVLAVGGNFTDAVTKIAFNQTAFCGISATCELARKIEDTAGLDQAEFDKQFVGIAIRKQAEYEYISEVKEDNDVPPVKPIVTKPSSSSFPDEYLQRVVDATPDNGVTPTYLISKTDAQIEIARREAEQQRLQKLKETYDQYAQTRSLSDDVPMDDAYYALRDAEAELEKARQLASGSAIDSEQMFAYAEAKKRYEKSLVSYQDALVLINDNQESQAKLLAQQAISDAQGSTIVSKLITTPTNTATLDRGSGSGIVKKSDFPVPPITGNMDLGAHPDHGECERHTILGNCRAHAGVDIYAESASGKLTGPDAVVVASMGGTVIRSQQQTGYGHTIDILGDDGKIYRYAHIAPTTPDGDPVVAGERFEQGEPLTYVTGDGTVFGAKAAELGSTAAAEEYFNKNGWGSTNKPHIHFEIREQSVFGFSGTVDPSEFIPVLVSGKHIVAGGDTSDPNGTFMDFNKYVENIRNGVVDNSVLSNTDSPTSQTPRTTTEKVFDVALGLLTNPVGTIIDLIFSGNGSGSTNNSNNNNSNDNDNDDKKDPVVEPVEPPVKPQVGDLVTHALQASYVSASTSTTTEYRFAGDIIRTYKVKDAEEGLPLKDIDKNYGDTIQNRLILDYLCDGSIDARKQFSLGYSAFNPNNDASRVLTSTYLPITQTGRHCFVLETDIKNVINETNEKNNRSATTTFTVTAI